MLTGPGRRVIYYYLTTIFVCCLFDGSRYFSLAACPGDIILPTDLRFSFGARLAELGGAEKSTAGKLSRGPARNFAQGAQAV